MPFIKRVVEPKYVSRKPLDNSVKDDLEAVTNGTLVEALRQLACVVVYAEQIFQDLASQVKVVHLRAEKLKTKIDNVDKKVAELNAKEVPIPVGTLDAFSRLDSHYVSSQPLDTNLFSESNRPAFLKKLYETAVVSPVCIMRQIDQYRIDGCRSSRYFLCLPFFKDGKKKIDIEIEMRRPASYSGARDWLSDDDTLESICPPLSDSALLSSGENGSVTSPEDDDAFLRSLPTPEEKTYVLSLKYPYKDVPIDVTGVGFRRMTTLRRSFLQHVENLTKRKKRGRRRNTVSGDVDNRDIEAALKEAKLKHGRVLISSGSQTCPHGSGDVAGPSSSCRGQVCFRDDVTLHAYKDSSSKDRLNSLRKQILQKRRSQDKLAEDKEVQTNFDEGDKDINGSVGFRWFQRKARSRNSIIGGLGIYEELNRVKKSRRNIFSSLLSSTAIAEDKGSPSKSSTDSAVATSSTISTSSCSATGKGRGSSKKHSSLPIATLSNPMTIAVKMRENSARGTGKGEDGGQSSSGNWSASSSTRTSMESEVEPTRVAASPDLLNRSGSQTSLGKDSALSDRLTPNEERWQDSSNGYHSDSTYPSVRKPKMHFTKHYIKTDTARWLRSLDEEGGNGRSAGETTDAASSTGTLTPRIHRRTLSPLDAPFAFIDDGESSEFSVDTDGYYTSMHTDSGLRPLQSGHIKKNENFTFGLASRLSDLREHDDSDLSLNSLPSDKNLPFSKKSPLNEPPPPAEAAKSDAKSIPGKKVPPPPPPRRSTLSSNGLTEGITVLSTIVSEVETAGQKESATDSAISSSETERKSSTSNSSEISSSSSTSSCQSSISATLSDSENDNGERLKQKTSINSARIPSLCVVTPSPSDDEGDKCEGTLQALQVAQEAIESLSRREVAGNGLNQPGEAKPWVFHPTAFSSLPRSSFRQKPTWATSSATTMTLPPSFKRSASFNGGNRPQTVSTWPRRPHPLLYQPAIMPVSDQQQGSSKPTTLTNSTSSMMSFAQQPPVWSHAIPGDGNSPSPPKNEDSRKMFLSDAHSSSRPGARVILNPAGQVIHTTGGSVLPFNPVSPTSLSPNGLDKVGGGFRASPTDANKTSPTGMTPPHRLGAYVKLDPSGSVFSQQSGRPVSSPSPVPSGQISQIPVRRASPCNLPASMTSCIPAQQPTRSYDSNTLPRWKPFQLNRPSPLFPSNGCSQTNREMIPPSYHMGTLPRRWNDFNFLRRDQQPPLLSSTPSPPESLASSKSGAYTRLDGHPTHLEPGVSSSKSLSPRGPLMNASFSDRKDPCHNSTSTQQQQQPSQDGVSQDAPTPAAMPLMQQLNYSRASKIPLASPTSPTINSLKCFQAATNNNALPPYYQPMEPNRAAASRGYLGLFPGSATVSNNNRITSQFNGMAPPPTGVFATQNPAMSSVRPGSSPQGLPVSYASAPPTSNQFSCSSVSSPSYVGTCWSAQPIRTGVPNSGANQHNGIYIPYSATSQPLTAMSSYMHRPPLLRSPIYGTPRKAPVVSSSQQMPSPIGLPPRARIPIGEPNLVGKLLNVTAQPPISTNGTPPRTHEAGTTLSCDSSKSLNPTLSTPPLPPSPGRGGPEKLKSSGMTTDELFAAIHQSKKKMNIKTDVDHRSVSPSSSARSDSPASLKSPGAKGYHPESGTLSPRSCSPLGLPGNRRSWAGGRSLPSPTPGAAALNDQRSLPPSTARDRRSWASDRLGPTKPTSMHDFKLLLLQAGRVSGKEGSERRRSATELLKPGSPIRGVASVGSPAVPPSPVQTPNRLTPDFSSPMQSYGSLSPGAQGASPVLRSTPRINVLNGRLHSKHVQNRGRVSSTALLPNRTDVLSTPIMEDEHSEEEESDACANWRG